jgi:ATP-dependent exoDNAse (exonuclease V) alpha subunit
MAFSISTIYQTKYCEHIVIYAKNKTQNHDDYILLYEFFEEQLLNSGKKLDFISGDAPLIDEINLLKSYCHTFDDDTYTTKLAKEEIKGRYRVILGLKPEKVVYNFNQIMTTDNAKELLEDIKHKKKCKLICDFLCSVF